MKKEGKETREASARMNTIESNVIPNKATFVFFHVGPEPTMPTMLARTIRLTNENAQIIQCTDRLTPAVPGVNFVYREELDCSRLMTARLQAFAGLGLSQPAVYLDTDMLVIKPIAISSLLHDKRASFCSRSFNINGSFIGVQRGIDFSEYAGKPLGEVYPYVACSTVTKDHSVWNELFQTLNALDPKFSIWYGDQEAMKVWARKNSGEIGTHPESMFGCLPEESAHLKDASIIHFKGAARKDRMRLVFEALTSVARNSRAEDKGSVF